MSNNKIMHWNKRKKSVGEQGRRGGFFTQRGKIERVGKKIDKKRFGQFHKYLELSEIAK